MALNDGSAAGVRANRVAIGGGSLGEFGTPSTIERHLKVVRAADVVQSAAKLSIFLEGVEGDPFGDVQRDLVDELFSPDVARRLQRELDAGGVGGGFDIVFAPGQLMALQKLAVGIGQPGPPTSFDEGALFDHFLIAAAQVNDVRDSLVDVASEDMKDVDLAIYAFRAGELNRVRHPPSIGGRAYQYWLGSSLPWPTNVENPDSFCETTFGMSLRRFVAVAAAPAIDRMAVNMGQPGDIPFNPHTYFSRTKVGAGQAVAVLQALTYRPANLRSPANDPSVYWSHIDLGERPMMPCGVGILVPSSLRHALERATTGVFWMLHTANAGDVGQLTTHFGRMFETYCLNVVQGLRSQSVSVSGEQAYGPTRSRKLSSDILVSALSSQGSMRIFIECRAGRPSRALFTTGDVSVFQAYLRDITAKLGQLHRCIQDHMQRAFTIPDDLAGPNDTYVPMLVVDEPFQWTLALNLDPPTGPLGRCCRWFVDDRGVGVGVVDG